MRIQCNVCEATEAKVLCCADEAALCAECDQKVHAANKLSSKHQRVPLTTSSSQMPKCDICQETTGYFFCLEDRAILCRRCDVAVHTVNRLVSTHQRFLVTGVKVGLQATSTGPGPSLSSEITRSDSIEKSSELDHHLSLKKRTAEVTTDQSSKKLYSVCGDDASSSKLPFSGGSTIGNFSRWQLDEYFELDSYNQNIDFADCGKFEDFDYSPTQRVADMNVDDDECMGQSPGTFWAVPEISSPPTSSGLHWPKITQTFSDFAAFVPDIISSPQQISKRQRRF